MWVRIGNLIHKERLFTLGITIGATGAAIWPQSTFVGKEWVEPRYPNTGYWRDVYDWWGEVPGIILVSVGSPLFIAGVGLLIASATELKTTYHFYTKGGKTACTLNVTPLVSPQFQGVGLSLKF